MNKAQRILLRNKHWKKHLRVHNIPWELKHKFIVYQKQTQPCCCRMCKHIQYDRKESYFKGKFHPEDIDPEIVKIVNKRFWDLL